MSILRRVKGQTIERYYSSPDFPVLGRNGGPLVVTESSALRATAVWACVRLIAETIASLPIHAYDQPRSDQRPVLTDLPQWLVKPNPEMTRFDLFERTLTALNLDGNAYWYFEHDNLGRVGQVWPIPPQMVVVFRDRDSKEITYRIANKTYTAANILHFRCFPGLDDLKGLSPIKTFAQSIGLGLSAEAYGSRFFEQGASMSGVIEVPDDVTDEQLKQMAQSWDKAHSGVANAHKPGFLTGGASWKQTSIPNDDAQFLESREFQITEIARIFRVQPHMIGDLTRATFSNIEQQSIEFVVHTIRPWLVRLEMALAPLLAGGSYLKFGVEGLLRGDTLSRYQAYALALQNHWMNSDEVRAKEDLDPLPNGEGQVFYGPLNMTPLGAQAADLGAAPKAMEDMVELAKALSPTTNVYLPEQPPAVVNVKNTPPAVHFQPPDVHVNVESGAVNVEAVPRTKSIERDPDGRILKVVES